MSESPDRGGGTGGQERGWHHLANATTAGTRGWPRPQGAEVTGGSGHGHGARHHDQPARGCSPTQSGSRSSHLALLLLQAAPSHHINIMVLTVPEPARGEPSEGKGPSRNPGRPLGQLILERHESKNGTNLEEVHQF